MCNKVKALLGNGAHRLDVLVEPEIENRSHMQATDRGMGIPCALGAIFLENLCQACGVLGQIGQLDGTILDEGDWFSVGFHRHHDVEPGFAQLGDLVLQHRIGDRCHPAPAVTGSRPREAEITHHLLELTQLDRVVGLILLDELHQQERFRVAGDKVLDGSPEHWNVAGEGNHGRIDQLHALRFEGHQMLRCVHGLVEGREVADADGLA